MPLTAQSHRFRSAFGRQTAEGTAQTTPAFEVPRYEGIIGPWHTLEEHATTDAGDMIQGFYVSAAGWTGEVNVPSFPDGTGLPWHSHLGTDTVTGTPPSVTHALKKAAAKPLLTVYNMLPGIQGGTDLWERGVDGFVKAAEIQGTAGQPIKHKFELIGKTYDSGQSAPTPTVINTIGTAGPYHSMIGSTLSLDFDSATAAQVRNIESFLIRSEYADATWIQTDELPARFLKFAKYRVGANITMVLQDYDVYRNTFFGSTTGTALSQATNTGTIDFTFPASPVADATRTLQVVVQTLRYEVTSAPAPDVSGDALRIEINATMQAPASGEPITVTFKNNVAAY